jgi:prepilin-type N-terminal cleavage/methylation domain-containing protein
MKKNLNKKEGFTLLEMLIVIAVIAVLSAIVIIAINPARQLAQARNVQRASDIRTIYNAVQQYYIDNKEWPTSSLSSSLQDICLEEDTAAQNNCISLNILVPNYLSAIPRDPLSTDTTGYQIAINSNSQTPALTASLSFNDYNLEPINIGQDDLAEMIEIVSDIEDALLKYKQDNGNFPLTPIDGIRLDELVDNFLLSYMGPVYDFTGSNLSSTGISFSSAGVMYYNIENNDLTGYDGQCLPHDIVDFSYQLYFYALPETTPSYFPEWYDTNAGGCIGTCPTSFQQVRDYSASLNRGYCFPVRSYLFN